MDNMEMNRGGGNGGRLLLLGALAALALNAEARRRLVGGSRDLLGTAHDTLDGTVKPALSTAATQTGHVAHVAQAAVQTAAQVAAQKSVQTLGTLREEVPGRAHSLLETAQEVAGTAAGVVAGKATELAHEVRGAAHDLAEERRREAQKALKKTRRKVKVGKKAGKKAGESLLAGVEGRVQTLLSSAHDSLEAGRRDAERKLARARRDAERELRSTRRDWNAAKLERAVEKRVAPLKKQTERELARLARGAGRTRQDSDSGMGGGTVALVLLGTGALVLARVPSARQAVLKAVEAVSPEAAQTLHQVSRNARNVVGTMWLESIEEASPPTPAPARATQAGTTGGTWGASTEPRTAGSGAAGNAPATSVSTPVDGVPGQGGAQTQDGTGKTN